jgi:hypothetical protein
MKAGKVGRRDSDGKIDVFRKESHATQHDQFSKEPSIIKSSY